MTERLLAGIDRFPCQGAGAWSLAPAALLLTVLIVWGVILGGCDRGPGPVLGTQKSQTPDGAETKIDTRVRVLLVPDARQCRLQPQGAVRLMDAASSSAPR